MINICSSCRAQEFSSLHCYPISDKECGQYIAKSDEKRQHEPGAKNDSGKIKAGLVLGGFSKALTAVAKVGTFGAAKYSPNGWKSVPDAESRYKDAIYRHLLLSESEELDDESGLPHLYHLAWNALALIELGEKNNG